MAATHFEIPDFLSHLPVDERGYPIPYFAPVVNGKPDFRLLDKEKFDICTQYNKCAVCGRKLLKKLYYFIAGPQGAKNKISTDPPMHKECSGFSLAACPHLHFEKAERRQINLPNGTVVDNPTQVLEKPSTMFLICADSFKVINNKALPGSKLIKYNPVKIAGYVYMKGILTPVS